MSQYELINDMELTKKTSKYIQEGNAYLHSLNTNNIKALLISIKRVENVNIDKVLSLEELMLKYEVMQNVEKILQNFDIKPQRIGCFFFDFSMIKPAYITIYSQIQSKLELTLNAKYRKFIEDIRIEIKRYINILNISESDIKSYKEALKILRYERAENLPALIKLNIAIKIQRLYFNKELNELLEVQKLAKYFIK